MSIWLVGGGIGRYDMGVGTLVNTVLLAVLLGLPATARSECLVYRGQLIFGRVLKCGSATPYYEELVARNRSRYPDAVVLPRGGIVISVAVHARRGLVCHPERAPACVATTGAPGDSIARYLWNAASVSCTDYEGKEVTLHVSKSCCDVLSKGYSFCGAFLLAEPAPSALVKWFTETEDEAGASQ